MLSNRIRMLRQAHNLRQEDLARLLCVSKSTVGMYEQGRREPGLDSLVTLSRFFGVSLDYLVTGGEGQSGTGRDICPCASCFWKRNSRLTGQCRCFCQTPQTGRTDIP